LCSFCPSLSLNDVCHWLRLKARAIAAFGLTPLSRNNLSNSQQGARREVRGVQWVTRARDNMQYQTKRNLPVNKGGQVIKDQIVKLTGSKWKKLAGWTLRRMEAWVEVDGEMRLMVFITNNTSWSASSVCHPLAGVDGLAGLCAAALRGAYRAMGA